MTAGGEREEGERPIRRYQLSNKDLPLAVDASYTSAGRERLVSLRRRDPRFRGCHIRVIRQRLPVPTGVLYQPFRRRAQTDAVAC